MPRLFAPLSFAALASSLEIPDMDAKLDIVRAWHADYHLGSLRTDNETSREQAFNHDIFEVILGYRQKPRSPYTFEPKSSTDSGQVPDARIGFFDPEHGVERTVAVVELKGASVSLDRPQRRGNNQTPVEQGFKYRPQYRGCDFVIVSNFYETRLYQDTIMDSERWTLDDLVDPADDHLAFRRFYLALNAQNFVSAAGQTATQTMLTDIRIKQEQVGRRFYREYKLARAALIANIRLLNPELRDDARAAIQLAQKIIDRVVFTCFAEDRGLLPENTLHRVVAEAAGSSFGTLWGTLKGFFSAVDGGSDRLGIPGGYNGGLFAADPKLDNLRLGDEPLKAVARLGDFDFANELSVTVLGHIFEQSIADLDLLRSQESTTSSATTSGLMVDSQRRRDGIYYTPDAVVRLMVEQCLGRYLKQTEEAILLEERLRENINDVNYARRERAAYRRYQERLRAVRVLDPACGSGAFLVGALDFLLAEHARVGEILHDELLAGDALVRDVLQRNLYGVDLNDESVEISRLSLWLRTASRGHQLTTLDSTIRTGHSLLSNPDETEAPFDWTLSFPEVMADGGFDVVIGNPPYVDSKIMVRSSPDERAAISRSFSTARGNWDLFVPFYQRAFDLTRMGGYCAMIVPNKILGTPYSSALRAHVAVHGSLASLTDLSASAVFDVAVYPVIVVTAKSKLAEPLTIQIGISRDFVWDLPRSSVTQQWSELVNANKPEVPSGTRQLADKFEVSAAASTAEAYELTPMLVDDPNAAGAHVINTGTIDPYWTDWGLWPMRYLKRDYLAPVVGPRGSPKVKTWTNESKVVVAGMAKAVEAVYSEASSVLPATSTVVVTRKGSDGPSALAALAILNSKSFSDRFMSANAYTAMSGGYVTITKVNLGSAVLPNLSDEAFDQLGSLGAEAHLAMTSIGEASRALRSLLISEYGPDVWTVKLKRWWERDFPQFCQRLGVRISLQQKADLLPVFEGRAAACLSLAEGFEAIVTKIEVVVSAGYEPGTAPPV